MEMEKNKIIDGYIRVYNKMIEDNSKYLVTPEELYTYCLLFNNRRKDETMLTNIRIIESTMSCKAKFSNRKATNRQKIKNAVLGLVKKDILNVIGETDIKNIKTDTVFMLKINEKFLNQEFGDTFNGYEQLWSTDFKMMLTPYELMIYVLSNRFSDKGGFKGSYDRWAKLLSVSRNTAIKLLDEAEKRGIIEIKKGESLKRNRKDVNKYFSVIF